MPICTNCGSRQPDAAAFCDECGHPLRAQSPIAPPSPVVAHARTVVASSPASGLCPVCGAQTVAGDPFCTNCGAALEAPSATAGQAAPSPQASFGPTVVAGMGRAAAQHVAEMLEVLPSAAAPEPVKPIVPDDAGTFPPAPAPPLSGVSRCTSCGAELAPGSRFCDMCGAPVIAPSTSSPVEPVAEERTVIASPQPPPFEVPEEVPGPTPAPWSARDIDEAGGRTVLSSPPPLPIEEDEPQPWSAPPPWPPAAGADAGGRTVVSSPTPSPFDEAPEPAWSQLWSTPAPAPGYAEAPEPAPVSGKFVVQATDAPLPFPPGRSEFIVGREDPINGIFPDIDLTDHGGDEGGVSRKHARVTLRGGQFVIEDLNSTNHTFVNRSQLGFGEQRALQDGDEVSFGRVKVTFQLL